jgi:hypothetical protein
MIRNFITLLYGNCFYHFIVLLAGNSTEQDQLVFEAVTAVVMERFLPGKMQCSSLRAT